MNTWYLDNRACNGEPQLLLLGKLSFKVWLTLSLCRMVCSKEQGDSCCGSPWCFAHLDIQRVMRIQTHHLDNTVDDFVFSKPNMVKHAG